MVLTKVGQAVEFDGHNIQLKDIWKELPEVTVSQPNTKDLEEYVKLQAHIGAQTQKVEALDKGFETNSDRLAQRKQVVAAILSFIVLGFSLYAIFLSPKRTQNEKWAFASIGTILGYWLSNT
jgi:hypothetical protein